MTSMENPIEVLTNPLNHSMKVSERRNASRKISVPIVDERLDQLTQKNSSLLRSLADLQNYIKIQERNFEAQSRTRGKEILTSLLQFLDSLDAGIAAGKDAEVLTSLRKNLLDIVAKFNLKPIETENKKVDINFHEVVGIVNGDEDDIIAHEVQKGYVLNDEVIRTSKVIVKKKGD